MDLSLRLMIFRHESCKEPTGHLIYFSDFMSEDTEAERHDLTRPRKQAKDGSEMQA